MKSILRIIAILLALVCLLVLIPSGAIVAQAEVIELAPDAKKGMPHLESGYVGKWEYVDPSISVKIEMGRFEGTVYQVARVKLANVTQLRTITTGGIRTEATALPNTLAKKVNSVLAINGDFATDPYRRNGYVCRQGQEMRNTCDGKFDVLIIDDKGDLHILPQATKADVEAFEGNILHGYTFGPGLVIDGVCQTGFKDQNNSADREAQRMIFAQVGPLEYLCITSQGPEQKDPEGLTKKQGLTLEQAARLAASFEGVQNAYNLDGGSSAAMIFNGEKINNFPGYSKVRPLYDMICFVSAWQAE